MNPKIFIEQKRNAYEHPAGSIASFVRGLCSNAISDYQVSAWLMAVAIRGLTPRELSELTQAMVASGVSFTRQPNDGFWIDKHSTGGVGDKTSLVIVPLVIATADRLFGKGAVKIPMVSGRGLGHTGGTLDKLESVPGFVTTLSEAQRMSYLGCQGFFMMGQSESFVPADRKLYALRDVTATIDSVPLIVSSIMSKKIAEGLDALVIDLKTGIGAFMKTIEEARVLGDALRSTAQQHGMGIRVWLTAMDEPLGRMIGNALEVQECYDLVTHYRAADPGLLEIVLTLSASMIELASKGSVGYPQAREELTFTLEHQTAKPLFETLLKCQGGDLNLFQQRLDAMRNGHRVQLRANTSGYVTTMDPRTLGNLFVSIGGGRTRMDQAVNGWVGFELHKKVGDAVAIADPLVTAYISDSAHEATVLEGLRAAVIIGNDAVAKGRWVIECLK